MSSAQKLRFAVLATDIAIFSIKDNQLMVRLIKVHRPPYFNKSEGLPGGLIAPNETAEEAAIRLIKEKALINPRKVFIEQLYTFSSVDRDPRGRVVAVAYIALVPWEKLVALESGDTDEVWWKPAQYVGKLAYDHNEVLLTAIERLKSKVKYTTMISKLMPEEFTLTELEHVYESILGYELDKRNFRKKLNKLELLEPLPYKKREGNYRPAQLYKFSSGKVIEENII